MQKSRTTLQLEKGVSLQNRGHLAEAEAIYRQVLEKSPRNADALHFLGVAAHQTGRTAEAIQLMAQSLSENSQNVHALLNLAGILKDQRNFERSALLYETALALEPRDAAAHSNLGVVLGELQRFDEAAVCHQRAIELNPKMCAAYCNLGAIHHAREDYEEALGCFNKAYALDPRAHQVCGNLGAVLVDMGEYEDGLRHCDEALALQPLWEFAHTNRAAALLKLKRFPEAIDACQQALALNPFSHNALNNLGNALREEGKLNEAAKYLRKALEIMPNGGKIYENLGVTLRDMGMLGEALNCLQRAVELNPDDAATIRCLGALHCMTGAAVEAVDCFRKTLELEPGIADVYSDLLLTLNYLPHKPEDLFAEHLKFAEACEKPLKKFARPHTNDADPHRKLRVGYVSGDFRKHPVAIFMEPVFASYSREEFEVYCYSNFNKPDSVTGRIRAMVDHWRDVEGMPDEKMDDLVRDDAIDILVDLSGHTAAHRLMVMARKPAPVQVTMVGYMQTTGLSAIDYRITDETLDPIGQSEHLSTEELVRLPAGSLSFRMPKDTPPVSALPALTNGYVTFASFNTLAKITDEVIATWSQVLNAVPGSRLLAVGSSGNTIRARFEANGIGSNRVEIVKRLPMYEYLALHHRADFVLDTFPYNGGTVNFIGAWMGLPFVTMTGANTVSRHGARVLATIGMPELAAANTAEYVAKAVNAVSDLNRLAQWRAALRPRLEAQATDGSTFTGHLEREYRKMWQRWCAKQASTTRIQPAQILCAA